MQVLYLIIDLVVIASLAVLGLTVLLQNRKLPLNRYFAYFVASVSIWIVANYISNDTRNTTHAATIANYFVFGFSFLAVIFLLQFAITLSGNKRAQKRFNFFKLPIALVTILCFTPLTIQGVELQDSVYAVHFGPLVALYGVSLIITTASIIVITRRGMKRTNDKMQEARLAVLFKSFAISMPLLLVVQFILPAVTGWFGLTNIGILAMLIMVFGLYYGVLKHGLFDLKLIVARSTTYVLSLTFVGGLFVSTTFAVSHLLLRDSNLDNAALQAIYTLLAVGSGLVYAPSKKFFDKATNRLFFRDAFDSQAFLDEFNKVLVSTYDLNLLLRKSAAIIEANIKPTFAVFAIWETDATPRKFIGATANQKLVLDEKEIGFMRSAVLRLRKKVIVTDLLDPNYGDLQKLFRAHDVNIVARLSAAKQREEGVGYLMLGAKKSGNMYSAQDLQVIEIISNELVIAVQNALRFEEIENFNATLQARVTEATRRLRRTNEKLKALDEAKDDFVSMASHQLRTPLTSIKGYTSMVLEGDAGKINATQRKLLEQSFFSSQRMVYLIADLLNVSRLKTGKFIIEPAPVNLAEVVAQEIEQLKDVAAGRQLALSYELPKTFPEIMLDETKTRQVIMNFVDNAIYYTPAGGHIEVKLSETPTSVEFRVIDDGIGVSKSEQPHLFTKFYRAGNARKARPDGTGLGLFMAKKVIVAEGGAIIFETQEGKGSTFGFTFPKTKAARPGQTASGPISASVTPD